MNRCPITYYPCGEHRYSAEGLRLLSPKLKELHDFSYTAKEQLEIAYHQSAKISIQGVQPKLSVVLNVLKGEFEVVEKRGTFIFKPPSQTYAELPQNEDLTMRLAQLVGLETPLHGMIYNKDGTMTYFIRRFDHPSRKQRVSTEDFSQLLGLSRDTKYESSIEKMIPVIEKYCTFPLLEKVKFFRLIVFNFLVGNEDAHLKNFTLIRRGDKVELSPCYDLVNSSIVIKAQEEMALSLRGKKANIKRSDLVEYLGKERLGLSQEIIDEELHQFKAARDSWVQLIKNSFLSSDLQDRYLLLVNERRSRLNLT